MRGLVRRQSWGSKSIPVIVARGWSEEEKQAYRLADNELAARASWDPDLLRSELRDLKFSGFDLDLIGFEPDRLEDILAGLGSSGLTDPDSVPEVPDQPGHSARRHMAVGRPPDRLRRQHQRGGCRASAGGIAASPDGHRSALWGRLRSVLASAPWPRLRQARAGQGAQRRSRRLAAGLCAVYRGCRLCLARRAARRRRRCRSGGLRVAAARSDRLGQAALHT